MEIKPPNSTNIRILPTGWYCPRCLRMNAPSNDFCTCIEKQNDKKLMLKLPKEKNQNNPFFPPII